MIIADKKKVSGKYYGLILNYDSFGDKREVTDIMPVFEEEQPLTWELFKRTIVDNPPSKILDVGCGSGFWALLMKSVFGESEVYAIDKNKKAIEFINENASLNQIEIKPILSLFQEFDFGDQKFDLIILTPPYHIYPYSVQSHIPYFARGGWDGQQEFYSQIQTAHSLLSDNGRILFNMMCVGETLPNFVNIISSVFNHHVSLEYYNLLPPVSTKFFLESVYDQPSFRDYYMLKLFPEKFPIIFYTAGIIEKSNTFKLSVLSADQARYGASWRKRIELHKEINKF